MKLSLLKNRVLLVFILFYFFSFHSFGQEIKDSIIVSENTFVSEQAPSIPHNGETDMGVSIDKANKDSRETYLKFDISSLYGKPELYKVSLSIGASVKQEEPWHPVPDLYINIYEYTNAWSASTITWDNRLEAGPKLIAEADIQLFHRYYISGTAEDDLQLTKYINDAMANDLQEISLVLTGKEETPGSRIWVSSDNWEPARLIVEYKDVDVYVDKIIVSGAGNDNTISTDKGTLQLQTEILPADATAKGVTWELINGTGKAKISKSGKVTAILNGTVTVIAKSVDGGWTESAPFTITISGQNPGLNDLSYINNGIFENDGEPTGWRYGGGDFLVNNGVLEIKPLAIGNPWDTDINQNLEVPYSLKDSMFILSVKAWAEIDRSFTIDFEDSNNDYNRYGISSDLTSNGNSEWTFDLTTEPTTYLFHVTFSGMLENTIQSFNFMAGTTEGKVFIDSVFLIPERDYALKSQKLRSSSFKVYPNPVGDENMLTVEMEANNTKIAIYNAIGQKMMEKISTGNVAKFDVSSLHRGLYFIRLNNGASQKFIK